MSREMTNSNGELDDLQLLSTRRLCQLIDTGDRNLRRLIACGRFPRWDAKVGRGLRWKKSTVARWLAEQTNGNGARNG